MSLLCRAMGKSGHLESCLSHRWTIKPPVGKEVGSEKEREGEREIEEVDLE